MWGSYKLEVAQTLDARINAVLCPSVPLTQRAAFSATFAVNGTISMCFHDFMEARVKPRHVKRDDITDSILRYITGGDTYIIVEGPHSAGKSTAVKVAVAVLSHTRVVRKVDCLKLGSIAAGAISSDMEHVLGALYLGDEYNSQLRGNLPASHRPSLALPSYPELRDAVFRRPTQGSEPEPVFLVEAAEHLSVSVLLALLSFGKKLLTPTFSPWPQ